MKNKSQIFFLLAIISIQACRKDPTFCPYDANSIQTGDSVYVKDPLLEGGWIFSNFENCATMEKEYPPEGSRASKMSINFHENTYSYWYEYINVKARGEINSSCGKFRTYKNNKINIILFGSTLVGGITFWESQYFMALDNSLFYLIENNQLKIYFREEDNKINIMTFFRTQNLTIGC